MARSDIQFNRFRQSLRILARNIFLLPHLLNNYKDMALLGRRRIRALELSITYRCQLRCDQCSCARTRDPKRKELTIDEYVSVIDQAIELGAFQFNLTGGEPLLRKDVVLAVLDHIRSKHRYAHICTNAVLLDLACLEELRRHGLNSVEMGLDSADEETHDTNRDAGNYRQVLATARRARHMSCQVIFNTVITHEKIANGDMTALVKLARRYGAILQITPPCAMGFWLGRDDIFLTPDEEQFFRSLLREPYVRSDIFSSFWGLNCSAGREKLAITPYGDIMPCSLVQLFYGNVRTTPLKDAWDDILKNPYYLRGCPKGCLTSFDRQFIQDCVAEGKLYG